MNICKPARKTEHVVVHLTPEDKAAVTAAAEAAGVTVAEFGRQALATAVAGASR
jgi:uncharacterized protein (DUF1778 family)